MIMNLEYLVKEYFSEVTTMQLATIKEGQPWICTVYFVADNNNNLYWTSGRSRQHSVEILNDSRVAATVVKDTVKKQAIQIQGVGTEVLDDDLERVHELYQSKFGAKNYDLDDMKLHTIDGRSYWKLKPTTMKFWDEVNFPDSPKQTIDLR